MKIWKKFFLFLMVLAIVASAGALLLIRRGFKATAEPSMLEIAAARFVRNSAIPLRERNLQNPLQITPQILTEARDHFIARCSNCHGTDGRGHTQMGQSLYPRVPDLLSPLSQSLSDGQLHYIIENGVQFTGMPAWSLVHQETEDDSWKLVIFIRYLRPLSAKQKSQESEISDSARYVGSASCQKCHAQIYQRWQKTAMANVVRDPRQHPEAIIPDLTTDPIAHFTKDDVALVYGSLWKQRYFTKIGDDYFPEPAQWDIPHGVWRPYFVAKGTDWWEPFYPPDNMQRPTGPTCDGCHSVDYNIHTKQVAEWNVGCEKCHGPGSQHMAHPSRANILNPARMDYVAASDTCIQCHSQGRPLTIPIEGKYYDWPVGYRVGLRLQDYWKLEGHTLGATSFTHFADGTGHKNRMQGNDFVQSMMYRRGVTCFSCHDAHGTGSYAQLIKPADKICLDCHGPLSPNGPRTATLEEHTHHKPGSAGSQCVACHMPQIQTTIADVKVHAHTFKFITPDMTDQYKIPNPCISCHADKTTAWANDAMRRWPERSPWRLQ
jgi:predicted CXXCH cytochrome family protein